MMAYRITKLDILKSFYQRIINVKIYDFRLVVLQRKTRRLHQCYFQNYLFFARTFCLSQYLGNHISNDKINQYFDLLIKRHSLYHDVSAWTSIYGINEPKSINLLEDTFSKVIKCKQEKMELLQIQNETQDSELKELAMKDLYAIEEQMTQFQDEVFDTLFYSLESQKISQFNLEVTAGVGGQEAMLFSEEILKMYYSYCLNNGWSVENYTSEITELGGIRSGCLQINDESAYNKLKFEGGIHRVQRVPKTEKSSRIHTSTASVAIVPLPSEITVSIESKDIKVDTMRASGAGGQHVNKTESAVRVTHFSSGFVVECQVSRSQNQNLKEAMRKLRAKLYQTQVDDQETKLHTKRKLQIGTKARSEKIRTYNYPQDRVTDHRLSLSVYNLENILSGGTSLDKLLNGLVTYGKNERLNEIIDLVIK